MKGLQVVEIFDSIEGEGIRTGMPVTFIRLAGCNLRCKYCDTLYAQNISDGTVMSIDEIVGKVNYKAVTITGGEPLISPEVTELIDKLNEQGKYINIETNGSINIIPFIASLRAGKGFFTMDYKCACSGMTSEMLESNFDLLDNNDVVKFVVSNLDDFALIRAFLLNHSKFRGTIFVSPCYGTIEMSKVVDEVKILVNKYPKFDIRFQVQLHKIVYPVDMRGV
jgi:7-carboxy-7-deazaguanine synthase